MLDNLIKLAVIAKLAELEGIPVGTESGRRLTGENLRQQGIDLTPDQLRAALANNYCDIAERLGLQFFQALPVVALEQFTLMSIIRNEDCAGLLKSLNISFMLTYLTPEASGEAFDHLLGLEALRQRVAESRNLTMRPMTVHPGRTRH